MNILKGKISSIKVNGDLSIVKDFSHIFFYL